MKTKFQREHENKNKNKNKEFFSHSAYWLPTRKNYLTIYFIFLYLILGQLVTTEIRFFALKSKKEKGTGYMSERFLM